MGVLSVVEFAVGLNTDGFLLKRVYLNLVTEIFKGKSLLYFGKNMVN